MSVHPSENDQEAEERLMGGEERGQGADARTVRESQARRGYLLSFGAEVLERSIIEERR